jgi:hypothetical protein
MSALVKAFDKVSPVSKPMRKSREGVPEPVTLFRLVRASGGGRRSGQRHLTPLSKTSRPRAKT